MSDRRELIFGFVLPLGIDKDLVEDSLRTALCAADYTVDRVRVSHKLEEFAEQKPANETYLKRKERLMDAGDKMRRLWSDYVNRDRSGKSRKDRGDAVVLAAISEIREMREKANLAGLTLPADQAEREELLKVKGNAPRQNVAYLIDSLKHPDEIQLLKRIYGPAFVTVGVYSPPEQRKAFLLKNQGASKKDHDSAKHVDDLMRRDETGEDALHSKIKLGQDVSDAFFITDFIVDATKEKHEIAQQFSRLIGLLFGDVYETPTREEFGMFIARGVQVRSGSLARQIGASILRSDGSVVAVGTNEAARPISGGQYWPEDDHEYAGRDMVYRSTDTSDEFRAEMLSDLLDRLDAAGALSDTFTAKSGDGSVDEEKRRSRLERLYFDKAGPLRKARLRDNIDYVRAVHAEGAAIIDAARHGVKTKKATMFATTFPCHECARHIVAAGIKEVVYLEPYPKSAVRALYDDSIQVDPHQRNKKKVTFRTFVGVSPSRYLEFFTVNQDRKDAHGQRVIFDFRKIPPHLPDHTPPAHAATVTEGLEFEGFKQFLQDRKADHPDTIPNNQ